MNTILKGIGAVVLFYIFNMFIMQILGQFIFIGNPVTISYHMFTYTGLMTLCGVIKKLNEVKDAIDKKKQI